MTGAVSTSLPAVLRAATERLTAAGVPSPGHDARALAAQVLGVRPGELGRVIRLEPGELAAYQVLVAERVRRVPLQHLTGAAGFRHLTLAVGPGVFVPRPETETLVQWALESLAADGTGAPVVVDLGTGSGAIALAVAQEWPAAQVHAVDCDPRALAWARRNADARAAAGDHPITLHRGDARSPATLAELDGTVDLVLTNPPYIPVGAGVEPEVAEHDPPAALWGGQDGLDTVRALVPRARRLLRPGGRFAVEHADTQGGRVAALLRNAAGWADVEDHRDLVGRPRFTTARAVPDWAAPCNDRGGQP